MASVTTFIRNTPASSLQAYFTQTGITLPSPIDWAAPEPEIARVTLRLVDEMNDEDRARVVNDGERVSALADDAGQTALYSVVDDRTVLDDLANGHARSLWMFLNESVRFRHAEEVRFTDERRRGRSWDGFICDPNCVVRQDQAALDAFKAALQETRSPSGPDAAVDDHHAPWLQSQGPDRGGAADRREVSATLGHPG